jgi:hypothetical protein
VLKTSLVNLDKEQNDYLIRRHLDDLELFMMHVARTLLSCAYVGIHFDGYDSKVLPFLLLDPKEKTVPYIRHIINR